MASASASSCAQSTCPGLMAYMPAPPVRAAKLQKLGVEAVAEEELTVGSEIGKGRFKTVYAGYHKNHGPVAVLRITADSECNEVRMLGLLAKMENYFLHFPEIFGAKEDPRSGDLLLAQEVSMLGSVRSVLKEADLAPLLTPVHRLSIAAQIAGAVDILETARIIHTDIACRNVLLFQLEDDPELTTVKLTDFGFAACLPSDADHITSRQPQATRWCAPETVASMKWSDKTDIWSLGASLWELFAGGAAPWPRLGKRADVAKRLREVSQDADVHAEFPAPGLGKYPLVAHTAVLSCLRVDPAARPPASSVALVFEELVDVVGMFNGQVDRIDAGLLKVRDPVTTDAASLHPVASPPVQERSRVRKATPRMRSEASTECSSPAGTARVYKHEASSSTEDVQRAHGAAVWRQLSVSQVGSSTNDTSSQGDRSRRDSIDESAPWHGGSVTGTPNRSGVASTPSTTDTPIMGAGKLRAHERSVAAKVLPETVENHFGALKGFLSSSQAGAALSRDQLHAMKQEIASAQVREAYWSGVSTSETNTAGAAAVPESSSTVLPLKPRGGASWGLPDQVPLQSDKYTLWTYVGPSLRREDFTREVDARSALHSRSATPSVLRDPAGRALDGRSWRTTCA